MNISNLISNEEIKKELEGVRPDNILEGNFWKIPDGKSLIRLLPRLESKVPWKLVYSHRFNDVDGNYFYGTCRLTFKKNDCPICKKAWSMWQSDSKKIKEIGYAVRRMPRYLFNCYIINDSQNPENNGSIKIVSVGQKLFELIIESYNSEDLGVAIFDIENGFDFEINKKKMEGNSNFPDYHASRFVFKRYKIKSWSEITNSLINIDNLIKEETPESLMNTFSFMGFNVDKKDLFLKSKDSKNNQILEKEKVVNNSKDDVDNIDNIDNDDGIDISELENLDFENLKEIDIDEELDNL